MSDSDDNFDFYHDADGQNFQTKYWEVLKKDFLETDRLHSLLMADTIKEFDELMRNKDVRNDPEVEFHLRSLPVQMKKVHEAQKNAIRQTRVLRRVLKSKNGIEAEDEPMDEIPTKSQFEIDTEMFLRWYAKNEAKKAAEAQKRKERVEREREESRRAEEEERRKREDGERRRREAEEEMEKKRRMEWRAKEKAREKTGWEEARVEMERRRLRDQRRRREVYDRMREEGNRRLETERQARLQQGDSDGTEDSS